MINKKMFFVTVLVLILIAPCIGQSQGSGKVGVFNVVGAISQSEEGKAAFADLQKKVDARKESFAKQQQEIQTLQQQIQQQGATLNEEARVVLTRNLEKKQTNFQRATQDAQREFEQLRFDIMATIGKKLNGIVQTYAKENDFLVILDSSNQNNQVVFNAAAVDITTDIIKQFNLAQTSSTSTAATAPTVK